MTHTSTERPEALRLADDLEASSLFPGNGRTCNAKAAQELRRLHERVQELEAQVQRAAEIERAAILLRVKNRAVAGALLVEDFRSIVADRGPAAQNGDYLDGVNIPRLRDALTFLGRGNGIGEGEVANKLSEYVNAIARAVLACKDLLRSGVPAAPVPQGPKKWAPEEIEYGYMGIRWVSNERIHGRPTDHDVREYLLRTPTACGCHCEKCREFYAAAPKPPEAAKEKPVDAVLQMLLEEKAKKDALIAKGICPTCEGKGECGGQFTGGEWTCEECNGTGRAHGITGEA